MRIAFDPARRDRTLRDRGLDATPLGIDLPMGPLAEYFALEPLPRMYFGWLAAILVSYCVAATLMKYVYIQRYGWQ